ncbi:glycosyltransferase family protein [Stutzerimonas kirkiae]|uniref:glycosyltransferase family protein n=1 Tax=Stutzerimonas kirkiae TaxID=2211392 RepID=UPI0010382EE1|nr:glycosyltransferase [Stutzerimonas kirkiae]TBV12270.1 glycosyltransferase [Stutzerimonas kirkiae]TBV13240.1 glycosyltransferase [Stutzerimonas kirkiae]
MKVLFLVQKEQRAILDRLYDGIAAHCDCDIRWLSDEEQSDLKGYFRTKVDVPAYDRILFFLRFKKEIRQVRFIRSLPNLVILEHDAYQNYIPGKYRGRFSRHYRKLPSARVINSGHGVVRRLREEGVDAVFVPKGYDQALLRDLGEVRDIELGFVGSLKSGVYSERKAFLEALERVEPLQATRTNSGDDYLHALNRIRFFVSADIGMGEYMIKNFEAMACGCVLFAYDQGEEENRALGFVDMQNVVLYRSLDEFREKLERMRNDPGLAERVAIQGRQLVESRFRFADLGKEIVEAMRGPLRRIARHDFLWQRLRVFLLR